MTDKTPEQIIAEKITSAKHPETSLSKYRYSFCEQCESFNNVFKICNECNCFMPLKVRIPESLHKISCPKGKW